MQRNEFLEMCQKVSILKSDALNIKQNIPDELKIVCDGIIYYPVSYELSFKKGEAIHTVILHDLNANSIIHADLQRVDKFKNK